MRSLNEICYRHIIYEFYYGLFGDFKLIIDKNTGYFNATKLLNSYGIEYEDWKNLYGSDKLLNIIKNIKQYKSHNGIYELKGSNDFHEKITGIYLCKELLLDVLRVCSSKFYIKCNNIIINNYIDNFKALPIIELKEKINEIEEKSLHNSS
ncbi:N1R/p28-like protein [Mythimna separata entomopoxvirus 'L']|uniref:N1R/p28-like protein n=1 Tax=Mythimna separata entomopoxvirus 'L' TaxID=1293572 RepID=A0A916KQ34_9POXV|nr:N1R/p28-like protein [Mythimna separata entomopoxvirus 'L']CCU56297.1 N1R/p28-like protein [Mythimna separata entomopoxvirus 'L']